MGETVKALRGYWHGLFLDGRNEHGSHVLNLPQRSLELEQDADGNFLKDDAETILRAAEAKGFTAGRDAVVATFNECRDGDWTYYEFSDVSAELTALFYGTPEEQAADFDTAGRAALQGRD